MKPTSALSILGFLALCACASAEKPIAWTRADGRSVDQAALRQTQAQCRAEALAAGARYGQALALDAYAQLYPDIHFPKIDSSPLGDLPRASDEGYARRRQMELRDEMIRATMLACMARSGYLAQD